MFVVREGLKAMIQALNITCKCRCFLSFHFIFLFYYYLVCLNILKLLVIHIYFSLANVALADPNPGESCCSHAQLVLGDSQFFSDLALCGGHPSVRAFGALDPSAVRLLRQLPSRLRIRGFQWLVH